MHPSIIRALLAVSFVTCSLTANAANAQRFSSEELAWALSGKLGLAAVGLEAGARQQAVDSIFGKAKTIGGAPADPGSSLADCAADERKSAFAARILHYILRDAGAQSPSNCASNRGPSLPICSNWASSPTPWRLFTVPEMTRDWPSPT